MAGVSAFDTTRLSASVDGQPDVLWGQCVSGNFFDLLGLVPSRGRALTIGDDRSSSTPVAVISFRFWKRRFALDPGILGKTIVLKGIPFTIVGIAPNGFLGIEPGDSRDLWIPMSEWTALRLNDHVSVGILGRLKTGIGASHAQAELDAIYQASSADPFRSVSPADQRRDSRIVLIPGARGLSDLRDEYSVPLGILMAVVMAVLLIACANVANLMLSRAIARRKEMGLRLAIGASKSRLVRQLLTESLLLALIGGLLGFLLAAWGSDSLLALVSSGSAPLPIDVPHDARILAFTMGLSLAVGVLFGLAPAGRAARTDLNSVLKDSSAQAGVGRGMHLRRALVVLQVSLSVVLLVAAGLLARSLQELFRVNPGFERDRVLLVRAYPTIVGYQGARELDLYSRLQEGLREIPGVRSVSLSRFGFLGGRWTRRISLQGNTIQPSDATALCYPVSTAFFETMGVPLLKGRDFVSSDGPTSPRVAIVSESFGRTYLSRPDVIGRRLRFEDGSETEIEIVGVVKDVKSLSLRDASPRPAVYIPLQQTPGSTLGQITIEIRTAVNAAAGAAAIRRQAQALDPELPLVSAGTQAEFAAESLGTERLMSELAGAFAILALVLAAVGLYGVLSHDVAQRAREMAIRVAIGATHADLRRLVLERGLKLILPGALVGLAVALAVPRVLTSILFGVGPVDLLTLAGTSLLLAMVALLACYIPARRAMASDPLLALRSP